MKEKEKQRRESHRHNLSLYFGQQGLGVRISKRVQRRIRGDVWIQTRYEVVKLVGLFL
jgi:hypothetical protein